MVEPAPLRQPARLAPRPFAIAAALVYLVSFGSQILLAPPTTGPFGVVPFALVQVALVAAWIVVHTRRLRDAGRPPGLAFGIAAVYAIEVILLVIMVWLILTSTSGTTDSAGSESSILHLFVILYLFSLLGGDPGLGALQIWIAGFVVVMLLPVVIAIGFSIWAAMRPSMRRA